MSFLKTENKINDREQGQAKNDYRTIRKVMFNARTIDTTGSIYSVDNFNAARRLSGTLTLIRKKEK